MKYAQMNTASQMLLKIGFSDGDQKISSALSAKGTENHMRSTSSPVTDDLTIRIFKTIAMYCVRLPSLIMQLENIVQAGTGTVLTNAAKPLTLNR